MTVINTRNIIHIKKYVDSVVWKIWYQEENNSFFNKKKEGFIRNDIFDTTFFTREELLSRYKNYMIIDNIVKYKPHLTITCVNNESFDKYFNTEDELNEAYEEILKNGKDNTLINI